MRFKLTDGTVHDLPNLYGPEDWYMELEADELQEIVALATGEESELAQKELDARWAKGV
jgi:hypothetical protein